MVPRLELLWMDIKEEVVAANGIHHENVVDPDIYLHDSVTASRSGKD